jgi:hypothetical protein
MNDLFQCCTLKEVPQRAQSEREIGATAAPRRGRRHDPMRERHIWSSRFWKSRRPFLPGITSHIARSIGRDRSCAISERVSAFRFATPPWTSSGGCLVRTSAENPQARNVAQDAALIGTTNLKLAWRSSTSAGLCLIVCDDRAAWPRRGSLFLAKRVATLSSRTGVAAAVTTGWRSCPSE